MREEKRKKHKKQHVHTIALVGVFVDVTQMGSRYMVESSVLK